MNECWNFFRYAKSTELNEIISLVREYNLWFSHLKKKHFINKIKNNECIYESGILITYKITTQDTMLGSFKVSAGNTILEQIIKNKKKSNSNYLNHVFTKFVNCALGSVYLAVNNENFRAINFYKKMNMLKIADTRLDYNSKNTQYIKGCIYKTEKKNSGIVIH